VVTRNVRPVAAILAVTDEDEIERFSLANSPKFKSILEVADKQIREGKGVTHLDF